MIECDLTAACAKTTTTKQTDKSYNTASESIPGRPSQYFSGAIRSIKRRVDKTEQITCQPQRDEKVSRPDDDDDVGAQTS